MTVYRFKNGFTVNVPKGLTKAEEIEYWTETKVAMSFIIGVERVPPKRHAEGHKGLFLT